MAYKRHSQGGRFKAANFGDLGLRALREQQERQIRGLKEQNQQDQEYSKQHLRAMQGAAADEIRHNRELQNFYNKRDNLAIENTELRGRREVEALLGEAKEAEKQAKFWKDFSTTYSQQYLKAAGEIYDIATTAQSNHQMTALYHDEKHKKFLEGASTLNNLADHEGLNRQEKAWKDHSKGLITTDELSDTIGHLSEISLRINKKTQKAILQKEADEWDQEIFNLKLLADKAGIQWNAKTASQFMYLRKREILRYLGIDPGSEAGRKFFDDIAKKEFDIVEPLRRVSEVNALMVTKSELNEQSEKLIAPVQFLNSNPAEKKKGLITATGDSFIDYNSTLQTRINHDAGTYTMNDEGQVVPGSGNRHHAFIQIMESDIESGRFASKEQARNHTILQPHPDSDRHFHSDGKTMTYPSKQTWLGRYGQARDAAGETLEDKFEKAWSNYEKKISDQFNNDLKKRDSQAQISIAQQAESGEIDLSDPSIINQLKKTYSDLPDTTDMLDNYLTFSAYNKTGKVVTDNLTTLYKSGDLKNLNEYLQYLPKNEREAWDKKVEQLEVLDRMGYTGTDLTGKAKEILRGILGDEAVQPGALGTKHYGRVVEAIEADILKTFSEVYETAGDYDIEKIKALTDRIDQKINANGGMGEGIYRRRNTGDSALSTEFLFDIVEKDPHPPVTTEELEKKLSGGPLGLDNLFTGMENGVVRVKDAYTGSEKAKMLIPIDEADTAIRHINAGVPIKANKTVDFIFLRQPLVDGKKQYSKRDIWNKYFESIGAEVVIPEGSIQKADFGIENSPITVTRNLSDANKEVVGVLADLITEGIIDITNHQTEEYKRITEQEQVRTNFWHNFLNAPHPSADPNNRNPFFPR